MTRGRPMSPVPARPPLPRRELGAVLALAALGALALGLCLANYGPAIGPTGFHHLWAADDLLRGDVPHTSRGELFAGWPPLMPLVLAGFQGLGITPVLGAGALNALAYGAVLFSVAYLVLAASGNIAAALAAQFALLGSPALFQSMATLQTEPWFLGLLSLAAALLVRAEATGRAAPRWMSAAVLALACLQRYPGLCFLVVYSAWLFRASARAGDRRRALGTTLGFAALAAFPISLWMLRNVLRSGHYSGEREASYLSFEQNTADLAHTLGGWFAPKEWSPLLRAASLALVVAVVVVGLWLGWRRPTLQALRGITLLLGASVFGYALFLLACGSVSHLDRLGNRLCLPALPFLVALVAISAAGLPTAAEGTRRASWLGALALAPLAAPPATQAGAVWAFAREAHERGWAGLHTEAWMQSELYRFLAEIDIDGPVYSNMPELVFLAADHKAKMLSPFDQKETLRNSELHLEAGMIVWVTEGGFPVLRVKQLLELELLGAFPQGAVYRTRPR